MIIKLHRAGKSFKGVCRYLTHDARGADTSERLAWTHTLNLAANDDIGLAVNEMLWTFRAADALKREAGVATGGSRLEKPVKHFSLSWPVGQAPSKEHIIETVQAYMKHMGWQDRQAVLVAHNDTAHAHAHVVMNSVSPTDGRAVTSSNDWRRSSAFALTYEREQGQIHCEERLKPPQERQASPTREGWQRFKKSEVAFERAEVERLTKAPNYFQRHDATLMNGREWEALKAHQKQQREAFFMGGKEAFRTARNEAFREVREEFRGQWSAYYAAQKGGHGKAGLLAMKLALTQAQNKALDERRQKACDELRKDRDVIYDALLAQQRFDRSELTLRQQQGLRTYQLMDVAYPSPEAPRNVARAPSTWKPYDGDRQPRGNATSRFDRASRSAVDPDPRNSQRPVPPGMVDRTAPSPAIQTNDGFGREKKAEATRETVSGHQPGGAEVTEAHSEKARAEKAREMTDQASAKTKDGNAAILRASWNKSRRSRGGRD